MEETSKAKWAITLFSEKNILNSPWKLLLRGFVLFFSSKDFLTTRKKTVITQNSSSLDILDITTCSVKGTDLSLLWPHHSANGCCRNTTGYKWKHSGILTHVFWKTLFGAGGQREGRTGSRAENGSQGQNHHTLHGRFPPFPSFLPSLHPYLSCVLSDHMSLSVSGGGRVV